MLPQFYRSTPPAIRGQQNAGLADAASADVARQVSALGGSMIAEGRSRQSRSNVLAYSRSRRQVENWWLQRLQGLPARRKDLAATRLDGETGQNITGYEQELRDLPEQLNAEYERLSDGLSQESRDMLEKWFNAQAPSWSAQAVDVLEHLETEDVTAEILGLAGDDRAADALELLSQYGDRLSPADRQGIEAKIAKAAEGARMGAAQQYLVDLAKGSNWDAADAALQDPAFLGMWGLDLTEGGKLKTELGKWVSDEKALADRRRQMEREANNNALIADAKAGTLDLAKLWQQVRSGERDRAVALQAEEIVTRPRTENDPAAYGQLQDTLDGFARGAISQGEASARLNMIAGGLKPSTFEGARSTLANTYTAQVQAKQDVVGRARGQLVDVSSEQDWGILLASLTPGSQAAQTAGAKRKQQLALVSSVEDEIDQFIKRKPDASREEILRMGRIITAEVNGQTTLAASPWGEVLFEKQKSNIANQKSEAPSGLEDLWPSLNDEEKASVHMLLGKGVSAERIRKEAGQ